MSQQYPPPPAAPQFNQPAGQYVPGQPQAPQSTYGQPQSSPGAPAPRPVSSGLAITGFVLGLLALLLCLIPIVNVLAIVLAIAGGVLGAVALSKISKGTASGKGLALAGVILSVLAFIGSIGSTIFYAVVVNEVGQSIEASVQDFEDATADKGVAAEEDVEAAAAAALAIGEAATIGDYDVSVLGVTLNANEMVAAANEFNEAPTNQYVVVDLAVTYNGTEESDPWLDLSAAIQGSDARQYDDASCSAVLPNDAMDVPTLTTGGSAEFQFCMDVPPAALEGATLFVEETMSFDDTRVHWNVQ